MLLKPILAIFLRAVFFSALLLMASPRIAEALEARYDEAAGTISVYRDGSDKPILTQHAQPDHRPFIHPIEAPDGQGTLTEYSPGHHKHQTGLYWGFTRVNGRDYFHHPGAGYWRRVSASVLKAKSSGGGDVVQWQTVYDMLGENGEPVMTESQIWSMNEQGGEYLLDLQWTGDAKVGVTIGKYDYGGLFLRMPWRRGIRGEVFNSARQTGPRAEGQRAVWLDVGMQVEGRSDLAHIAIFDHPRNHGFPQPWRVDSQLGVGPAPARLGDWNIAKGEKVPIRHQLLVYSGTLDDVALTEKWSRYSGQRMASAQWGIAQQEGRSAEFLTPEKAIASMTIPDGFQVNTYAAEPMITQPMAFCWDDRGRLWIAENRDYESRGRGFSHSGDSRILVLEDTDRDGVADSRKVFLEGIPFPAAIATGFGGLWLGAPPNLLFVPDANGDDRADMDEIEIRLTGWGIRDRHETLNSLHWGPDGWLYGCQGFATPSRVGKPNGAGRIYKHRDPFPTDIGYDGDPVEINGGVWRYHPLKDRFEVVAHGFSNPWGLDYDAKGQFFISACVIPHLWHVIPGGIYHRQGGRHFSPYIYSDIRTIADHRHRSAHGGARVYLSDAFPDKYKKRIFMANIHEHAVLTDILQPQGSGFVGVHGDDFLLANNAQWIGFSVEIGPEGAVYILDWHDADICGKEVLNKDTGRVFRITPRESKATNWAGRYDDLRTMTSEALAKLQLSDSAWHARRARLILQHRAERNEVGAAAIAALTKMFHDTQADSDHRLRALWGLHVIGAAPPELLQGALQDPDEHIRAWAIQLICEDKSPSHQALEQFARMANQDRSPVVRLYLASALQRLPHDARWPIITALAQHGEDVEDHNIPKMIWFGLEPLVVEDPDRAIELAASTRIPLLAQHISRRLTDAEEFDILVSAVGRHALARRQLLLGMRDGLEGRYDMTAPQKWAAVYGELSKEGGEVAALSLQLAQQFGDTVAAKQMLETLANRGADVELRRQALQGLAGRKRPEVRPQLLALLDDESLRRDAIRATASFDDRRLTRALLDRYSDLPTEDKLEAVHALSSRPGSGRALTEAIRAGGVPKRDVPAYVARLLRRVVGNSFVDVWGPIDELSLDKEAEFAKFRALLTDSALTGADARGGRLVFKRTCAACHKMHGEGGMIGPEITGANRTNLEYILGNVLTPSAIIQDNYKMQIVLTDDGRVYSGVSADENERQLRLWIANREQPVVIAKSQIESREIAPVSMMPEGLLKNLSDKEVLDLVGYLRAPSQVPLPE
jgi:putative membrane-bound dehydrogenase-like protein